MTQEPIFDWWLTTLMRSANRNMGEAAEEAHIGAQSLRQTRTRHTLQRLVSRRRQDRDRGYLAHQTAYALRESAGV